MKRQKQPKDYNKPKYDRQKAKTQLAHVLEMDKQAKQHMQEIGLEACRK